MLPRTVRISDSQWAGDCGLSNSVSGIGGRSYHGGLADPDGDGARGN